MSKLNVKPVLTLEAAKAAAAAALAEAEKNNWAVAVAIVDDYGQLVYFARMDGCKNPPVGISQKKAAHAANYRRSTLVDAKRLAEGNSMMLVLPDFMPIEGGIPLIYENTVVGAIGVSGMTPEEDGLIAQKGAEAFERWVTI